MKRRDFLIGGVGALATGVTGCAGISQLIAPNWSNVTPLQMNRFLIGLDGAMNSITENPEGGRFLSEFQGQPPSEKDARLFRQGMRTLLLAGNFGDLSVAGQVHPGMQKRLQYSAPEMDAAVFGTIDQIKSLSPTARADMQLALREDPTLGDRVLEMIDLEAAAVGSSNRRRKQLHVMGKHIIGRLNHSSDMFINEYVTKCEKFTARPGSVAEMQRFMAARMGQTAFKARVQEAENAARYWQKQHIEDMPIGYQLVANEAGNESLSNESDQGHPQPTATVENGKSNRHYSSGLRMLGFGVLNFGVGALMLSITSANFKGGSDNFFDGMLLVYGLAGVTVGAILIPVGLITLSIGYSMMEAP